MAVGRLIGFPRIISVMLSAALADDLNRERPAWPGLSGYLTGRMPRQQMLEQCAVSNHAAASAVELRRCAPCPTGITQARVHRHIGRPQVFRVTITQHAQST